MKAFLHRIVTFYSVTLLYLCGAVTFILLMLVMDRHG